MAFNFFFKPKKIVIDCFTDNHFVFETSKINRANKFFPEWVKQLPTPSASTLNIRTCPGLKDLYKKSFVIPSWTEIDFIIKPDSSFEWKSASKMIIASHPENQFEGIFSGQKVCQIKIVAPWILKCNADLNILIHDPFWNRNKINDFQVSPGIMNINYINQCNINAFTDVDLSSPKQIKIEPFSPLAFLTPITDKDVEIKLHLVSEREMESFAKQHYFSGLHGHKKMKLAADKIQELNKPESKCPFGFKKH